MTDPLYASKERWYSRGAGRRLTPGTLIALLLLVVQGYGAAPPLRPSYRIDAVIEYDLGTFKASAVVTVPASPADPLNDASFFIYANAAGIAGGDGQKNIVVDGVSLGGEAIDYKLQGSVLRVSFEKPQAQPFSLKIDYHGVVPRSSGDSGAGLLGGMSAESLGGLGRLLGGSGEKTKSSNNDFGLYSYSGGILSLGSFWYPQLAVRRSGKWIDEEPKGLGDVSYADESDFDVTLALPADVTVASTGNPQGTPQPLPGGLQKQRYTARSVRDFAVLMSREYARKSTTITAGGKKITVEAYTTRKDESRLDNMLDIAGHALQFYSERFGEYPYGTFKVAEGTIRGGAGGMEFSCLTSLAPMLFVDWNQQISAMSGLLGSSGLDKALQGLNTGKPGETRAEAPPSPQQNLGGLLNMFLGPQMSMLNSLLEMTIAHETAHQWWAIAVGSDSLREPFVDESLTNYSAILYFENRYGRATAEKTIDMHLKTPYTMARMLGEPDAPANLPTSDYDGNLQYGAVVYGKGALYYDALRKAVGDQAFYSSLREYYAKYRGRLAGSKALLDIVEAKAPNAGADKLYRRWIEEKHGDEDISGGGSMGGLQDLLGPFLQLLGNAQGAPGARKP